MEQLSSKNTHQMTIDESRRLEVQLQDENLVITCRDELTNEVHSLSVNPKNVLEVTDYNCKDVRRLQWLLQNATTDPTHNGSDKPSIALDDAMEALTLKYVLMGELTAIKLAFTKHEKEELEKTVSRLAETVKKQNQLIKELTTRLASGYQKLDLQFSTEGISQFQFSPDKKTATYTSNGAWFGCFADYVFPSKGCYSFEVELKATSGNAMVGVALKGSERQNLYTQQKAWMIYFQNQHVYAAGSPSYSMYGSQPLPKLGYQNGDSIKVKVNIDRLTVSFKLNGITTGMTRLVLSAEEKNHLCPAICLYTQNDVVTFI